MPFTFITVRRIGFFFAMGQSESQEEDEQLDISAIQTLYKSFIMECPSGSLYLHEFKKIFGIKNDDSPESLYMDNLFRSFDMNGVSFSAVVKLYLTLV